MSAPRKRGDSEGKRVCTVSQRPCSYSADRKRTFRGGATDLIRGFALADQRGRLSCRRGCSMALMACTVISATASRDRKSVLQGERVSVSVDLGGSGTTKKKNT